MISPYVILKISSLKDGGSIWTNYVSSSWLNNDFKLFSMKDLIFLIKVYGIFALRDKSASVATLS